MCSNEVLQLPLFNLRGIEADVPPIFTEMEVKSVDVHGPSETTDGFVFLFVTTSSIAYDFHVVLDEIELLFE